MDDGSIAFTTCIAFCKALTGMGGHGWVREAGRGGGKVGGGTGSRSARPCRWWSTSPGCGGCSPGGGGLREARRPTRPPDPRHPGGAHPRPPQHRRRQAALRGRPPHPAAEVRPHRANTGVKIGGYDVPKGSIVMVNVWAVARIDGGGKR